MDPKLNPSRIPRDVGACSRGATHVRILLPFDTSFGRGRYGNRKDKNEESKGEPVDRRATNGMSLSPFRVFSSIDFVTAIVTFGTDSLSIDHSRK